MQDVPGFMQTMVAKDAGDEDPLAVLSDAPVTETPAKEAPAKTETPASTETPTTETPKKEEKPIVPVTETPIKEEPKKETPTTETPAPKPGEGKPVVPEKPVEPAKPTATDAVAKAREIAAKSDEQRKQEHAKFQETIETFKKVQLINPNIPDPDKYWNEDKTFNMMGWAKDYTKNVTIAIQQALLGGPLSATMFGILHDALRQEDEDRQVISTRATTAQTILGKLEGDFPILKTDEKLQTRFERAIWGEKARRENAAKAAGKELEPLTYEDYVELMKDLLPDGGPSNAPKPDNTETPHGGPTLGGDAVPKTELDDDIAGMMKAKNKQLF